MIRSVYIWCMFILLMATSHQGSAIGKSDYLITRERTHQDSLALFYTYSNKVQASDIFSHQEKLEKHIEKLSARLQKEGLTDHFLTTLFYRTHERFLKEYGENVSYDKLITEGKYNCISGTTLYAVILSSLHIPHTIFESEEHVLLIVHDGDSRFLFESTDALNGLITDEEMIIKHLEGFSEADDYAVKPDLLGESLPGYQKVESLAALAGLQYYNEAVLSYREGKLSEAYRLASRGYQLFPSGRLMLCIKTIISTIVNCDSVPEETKKVFRKEYLSYLGR